MEKMIDNYYCAYIDVLGYRNIIFDTSKTTDKKLEILKSIYEDLAQAFETSIREINGNTKEKIFIKSFSDCFYLESLNIEAILYACYRIYNDIFSYYRNFSHTEEYTPLLRGGVVKDWTKRFIDISSLVNNRLETNPVGLGIARAYNTSEKSNLSGMRLILSPEVVNDLKLVPMKDVTFECYQINCSAFQSDSSTWILYFTPIRENEKKEIVNLYELCWPDLNSCNFDHIKELLKIEVNFDSSNYRHFKKTAEIMLNALFLSDCKVRTSESFDKYKLLLENIINSK